MKTFRWQTLCLCLCLLAASPEAEAQQRKWGIGLGVIGVGLETVPMPYGPIWEQRVEGYLLGFEFHLFLKPDLFLEAQIPVGLMGFYIAGSAMDPGFRFPIALQAYVNLSRGSGKTRLLLGAGGKIEAFLKDISNEGGLTTALSLRPGVSIGFEHLWNDDKRAFQLRLRPYALLGVDIGEERGNPLLGVGFILEMSFVFYKAG